MIAHVILNLLNDLRKRIPDQMRGMLGSLSYLQVYEIVVVIDSPKIASNTCACLVIQGAI